MSDSRYLTAIRRLAAAVFVAFLVFAGPALAQTFPGLASERQEPKSAAPDKGISNISFLALLMRGGWAMLPLGACSLLGLAIIIERGLALGRSQINPPGFMPGLDKLYRTPGDTSAALAYCRQRPSAIARIMAAGVRKLPEGSRTAEQAIVDQGATEVARLRRNLRLLHGLAAITPTLGLLGTVWGMIRAFEAAGRVGLGHSETLTTGIYEALVATLTGLMIAVPVLVFYYIYLGIIDRAILELNDASQDFLVQHGGAPEAETEAASANGA